SSLLTFGPSLFPFPLCLFPFRLGRPMDVYRRLVESAPDAILVVEDHRIVFANPAAVSLCGTGDLIGRSVLDLFRSDHRAILRHHLAEWRTGKSTSIIDLSLKRPDGSTVDVGTVGAALPDGNSVHLVLRDITERKHAERGLRES